MNDTYLPLISGLVGALIGSASSILVMLIQSHYQAKRDLVNHGLQIALHDYKNRLEHGKAGTKVVPISLFVNYHIKVIKLASRGKLTPKSLEDLDAEINSFMETVKKIDNPVAK